MPRLLVDQDGFRIVHDVVSEQDVFILEQREGDDAMGQPHWRRVETKSTKVLSLLYRYIIAREMQEQK